MYNVVLIFPFSHFPVANWVRGMWVRRIKYRATYMYCVRSRPDKKRNMPFLIICLEAAVMTV